jgi:hypothetical protein
MLFIVLYETKDVLGKHRFGLSPHAYDTWEEADAKAKQQAAITKKRAWVAQIDRPNLIELVK